MLYWRYLLFQIPGMFVTGVVLLLLVEWTQLTPGLAWGLFGLWVVKDLALFPVTKIAYETPHMPHGPEALLGAEAIAQDDIEPEATGWVLVRGELWRACRRESEETISKGERLLVVETRERVLVVSEPEP